MYTYTEAHVENVGSELYRYTARISQISEDLETDQCNKDSLEN